MRFEGFHGRAGFGARPALLVVDLNVGFTDPSSPLACDLEEVVGANRRLLDAFRRAGAPVVFTTVAFDAAARQAASVFIDKVPALLTLRSGSRWVEIDPRLAPLPDEAVIVKSFASAFFGTPLASILNGHRVDTVVVTGASTSGCVRATAVDALQHNYRVVIPREAVGDRNAAAHEANLYDIDTKYGDVMPIDDVLAVLAAPALPGR